MDSPKSSPSSADSIFRSGESDIFGTRVLVGSSDFWAMRTEGGIFVDKSLFVKEFIESPSFYDVILRPRRFGKSLNLSMLGSFFSMYRKNASDLFRGLAIMEYENICNTHMGKYPVIELSMKQCIGKTWSMMKRSIARMMLRALTVFGEDVMNNIPGARMLVDCVMKDFKDGLNISDDGLWEMLGNLIRVLCKRDNSRVILLIDEYDAPLNVVFKDENDNEMRLDLFSNFYSFALKDNPSLWRACLVGIAEIQGAGTFSGLNNLQTYSINDEGFSEFFGFSEGEVMKVLTSPAVGMQGRDAYEYWSKSGGIRDWYNGYRIGKFLLINPWSFTCCISRGLKLRSYWARTAAVENLMDVLAERPSLARQVIEHSRLLLSAHARPIWFQDAFASRAAAQILANGGSIRDVFDRMSVTGLWAPGSTAIERYCDTGTRKFFEGRNPLTWTQFTRLSPEIMHDLEPLNPPRRREAAWFHQDINKLRMIAMNLGRRFPPNADQYKIRLFIGKTFFRRDPALRNWLREFHSLETVDSSRGVKPITLLLERDRIPPSAEFQLESLSAEEIRELEVDMTDHPPYTDRSILYPPRQRARRVREVRIIEGEHLREVATLFQNRVADKQVTIGILPNSNRFIIKTRELDRNCSEVHFIGSAHAPSMQSVNSAERF